MNRLIGYAGEKELANMLEKDIKALDVINIAFGHVVSGRVVWEHPECREPLARIRTIHPEVKLVLSIG
ncbi:MAG: chitinase, partial [Lachnospiraceae bacterium]|nr:chitinase [Lachnospiraceae bacterium]